MPKSDPAACRASQRPTASQPLTLISKASSPEKLIRQTRAASPATTASRQVMNGNASFSTARSGATRDRTSRDRGPTRATVAHCSVTLVSRTARWGHSVCSHSSIQSRTVAALPVVVVSTNRSADKRMTVPSSIAIPSTPHITP